MKKKILTPLGIAGFSVGTGIIGEAIGSQGLKDAGTTSGKFISPAVSISIGGSVINMARNIKRQKK